MQFITVIIATLAAVATATPSPDAFEKRTCVGREFDSMDKIEGIVS
jgi:hypothetical protein